ncbi:type II toxin-antitoxin system RelE/ParE family toxin [Riemerella columbina]|uniref:type II toxin-antitoxin system RelE/ParE family toxin n=1 Tax=Riemerella columbina TaxID=103810 RepID=UPI00035E26C7|nr:type II toxin-antitoxin system RelE/ParE family toxin [Riemerella columbina]
MYDIRTTEAFDKWLRKLKDLKAKSKILFRIQKLQYDEHFGDCKSVGNGIIELRINYAKGYRIYLKKVEGMMIILLVGGDKSTQQKDIDAAKQFWDEIKHKIKNGNDEI